MPTKRNERRGASRKPNSKYHRPISAEAVQIGDWLKHIREDIFGWSQLQVAALLSENIVDHIIAPRTVARWEAGYNIPSKRMIRRLAPLYGIPLEVMVRIVRNSDLDMLHEYQETMKEAVEG